MIDLLKEWQSLFSVVGGSVYFTWYTSRLLNALKNHRHDRDGVAYLPEKIEL